MSEQTDTTPATRHEQVAAGLRELADFIAAHPDLPLPRHSISFGFAVDADSDDDGFRLVRQAAQILDAPLTLDSAACARVDRAFGLVRFGASYASRGHMAQVYATDSYLGSVEPEGGEPR